MTILELLSKHDDLESSMDDLELYRRSYVGGSEYISGSYLLRHDMELQGSYKKRLRESVYVNYTAPIVDIYNSYLYRENPRRKIGGENLGKSKNTALHTFWENADMQGRGYASIMREIGRWASICGYMGVVVDKPVSNNAVSRAQELNMGIRPYISYYKPSEIINWAFDDNYNGPPVLSTLVLRERERTEKVEVFRIWRPDSWELWKIDNRKKNHAEKSEPVMVDSGENPLGKIPFVLFRNKDNLDEMSGVSDIVDISHINRRIYRYDSAAMEIINRTAFPFLEVPVDLLSGKNDAPIIIGTSNVLERAVGDGIGYRWIEPNHSSLQRILEWRQQCVADIRETAKMGGQQLQARQGSGVASGPALEIRFQQVNAVLSNKASLYEQAESNILALVAAWEDLSDNVEVHYPRKFGIRDIISDLDTAIRAKDVIISPIYDKLVQKSLAGKTLTDFGYSGDDITKVEADIDEQEYVPSPREMAIKGGMNGVSVTPTSKEQKQAQLDNMPGAMDKTPKTGGNGQ